MKKRRPILFWKKQPRLIAPRDLVPIDTRDRGPATFFHGREKELGVLRTACEHARSDNRGTIVFFQGPPGAGKTALLYECLEYAEADGWRTADISISALHNPDELAEELGRPRVRTKVRRTQTDVRVGLNAELHATVQHKRERSAEWAGLSVKQILKKAAGHHGLLLALDEVQAISEEAPVGSSQRASVVARLMDIHNGKLGVPVVLVAGGLGTSRKVLKSFGISRFMGYAVHLLGSLEDDAARNVIRDWLVFSGGAPADHPCLQHWIETIAAECHGWPQHILRYAPDAAQWLLDHGHVPAPQVPLSVLQAGQRKREEYYHERTADLGEDPFKY